MDLLRLSIYGLVEAVWLVLPAYAANGLAPLAKFLGKRHSIDGGRQFHGHPLFGSGKTWEGFGVGVAAAVAVALIEQAAFPFLPWSLSPVTLQLVPMGWQMGLLLGFGTMLGDLCGAFIKRRLGLKRGHPVPGLDQLDFIAGSLLLASAMAPIRWEWVLILVILTPLVHLLANAIAYLLKVKKEPY